MFFRFLLNTSRSLVDLRPNFRGILPIDAMSKRNYDEFSRSSQNYSGHDGRNYNNGNSMMNGGRFHPSSYSSSYTDVRRYNNNKYSRVLAYPYNNNRRFDNNNDVTSAVRANAEKEAEKLGFSSSIVGHVKTFDRKLQNALKSDQDLNLPREQYETLKYPIDKVDHLHVNREGNCAYANEFDNHGEWHRKGVWSDVFTPVDYYNRHSEDVMKSRLCWAYALERYKSESESKKEVNHKSDYTLVKSASVAPDKNEERADHKKSVPAPEHRKRTEPDRHEKSEPEHKKMKREHHYKETEPAEQQKKMEPDHSNKSEPEQPKKTEPERLKTTEPERFKNMDHEHLKKMDPERHR